MDQDQLEKLVKVPETNGNSYRSSLSVEATEILDYIRLTRPELYEHVLTEAKRQEGEKMLVLNVSDNVKVSYAPIKQEYRRFLNGPWDLGMIVDKVNFIFSGVQGIVNDYGRVLIVPDPIVIKMDYEGKECIVWNLGKALQILPTKSQQRKGLEAVNYRFNTSDNKVSVGFRYNDESRSDNGWWEEITPAAVRVNLDIKNFTERDLEEYDRLKAFIKKGKK